MELTNWKWFNYWFGNLRFVSFFVRVFSATKQDISDEFFLSFCFGCWIDFVLIIHNKYDFVIIWWCFLQSLDLPRIDRIIRCSLRSQGQNLSLSVTHFEYIVTMQFWYSLMCESHDFAWDFRATGGSDWAGTGEQRVNGRGANSWRERKMVEDGFEGYLRWKSGCVAFIWWTGIIIFSLLIMCLTFNTYTWCAMFFV